MRMVILLVALCVAAPLAGTAQVVINELLPAPGADWTDDGSYSSSEDEWIELVNAGAAPVDLAGYLVTDATGTPRIGLDGILAPGEHLFLTGELAVDWEVVNGYSAVGLSLNNSGDTVSLFQTAGGTTTQVDSHVYGATSADVSFGRMPDATGDFVPFDALEIGAGGVQPTPGGENGGEASPKILSFEVSPEFPTSADAVVVTARAGDTDGIAACTLLWSLSGVPQADVPLDRVEGDVELGTWETTVPAQPAGTQITLGVRISDGALLAQTNDVELTVGSGSSAVVLNEILADPGPEPGGDANGDGVRHTSDDEFVEIVNVSGAPVDVSAWELHDATGLRHTFADGTVIAAGDLFVVFGGGEPAGIPSAWAVASGGGLSLNNSGDDVRLVGMDGVTRDVHTYGSEANADQSLIRVPDGGPWTRPGDVGYEWAFSPGLSNSAPSGLAPESWSRIKALYRP